MTDTSSQTVIIDTHTHVIAADRERYPLVTEERSEAMVWVLDHAVVTEELFDLMDGAGVAAAVLVQAMAAYGADNRYLIDEVRTHQGRCVGVAAVGTEGADVGKGVEKMAEEGMRGVRVLDLGSGALSNGAAVAVAKKAAERDVPFVLMTNPGNLSSVRALLQAVPDVELVLDHCALPDLASGPPWSGAEALFELASFENLYLKVTSQTFDLAPRGTLSALGTEIVGRFGANRVMWGSDFSHTFDRPYRVLVELAEDVASAMSEEDRRQFLGGTALRLWPELDAR